MLPQLAGAAVSQVPTKLPQDGIAYTFFSYGNVSSIANNANYGYIRLNGVDPIFQSYSANLDPGQLTQLAVRRHVASSTRLAWNDTQRVPLPGKQDLGERVLFPERPQRPYRAWNILRTIATGHRETNMGLMVKASQAYVVSGVPDYIPYTAVTCNASTLPSCSPTVSDLGLKLLRSHYEQRDGNGTKIGTCSN